MTSAPGTGWQEAHASAVARDAEGWTCAACAPGNVRPSAWHVPQASTPVGSVWQVVHGVAPGAATRVP